MHVLTDVQEKAFDRSSLERGKFELYTYKVIIVQVKLSPPAACLYDSLIVTWIYLQ